jgi:hypothetical protein
MRNRMNFGVGLIREKIIIFGGEWTDKKRIEHYMKY